MEQSYGQMKQVIIGVDHGFHMMKTRNCIYENGVEVCDSKPAFDTNTLYYRGKYYKVGESRMKVKKNKTMDDDFFLATLSAVAKEIEYRQLQRELEIVLAVGLPFTWYGAEQKAFRNYFMRDGVWLHMQDSNHKKMKKQEMKVFTMYEGWDAEKETQNRSTLVGKTMLAGIESSNEFQEKREALIERKYNVDEIGQRILNGDGGSWIKEPYDPDTIFQLDRYHIYQEILRKIGDKEAQKEARELFEAEKIEELLEFITVYADSVETPDGKDKRSKNARELHTYLKNNREGLLPYQKQGKKIPEPREGILYKNMGVQESQNCTMITMRMKHRRMRWSKEGANNLAKVLYRKENKELCSTIERYTDDLIFTAQIKEIVETLSAAKAPTKDGKGNRYVDLIGKHVALLDAATTASRKVFRDAFIR